jgi:hypothetical protein
MDDFLLDYCFNAVYEGLKFRESTRRYANRLCAMRHCVEFLQKISSPTLRYATQHEIQFKIFWSTPRYAA